VASVRQLDPRWLQLSRSLSATRWETLRKVILPGVLGHVLTGVRLSIGILWIVLVPCEMLGVSAGLGYFILDTGLPGVLGADGDGAADWRVGVCPGCLGPWASLALGTCQPRVVIV